MYYPEVIEVRQVSRRELFPNEPRNRKSGNRYYQLMLVAG